MKAELHFDLSDPSDRAAHLRCLKADNLVYALNEIRDWIRDKQKSEAAITIESVREAFFEALTDERLNLEELMQ